MIRTPLCLAGRSSYARFVAHVDDCAWARRELQKTTKATGFGMFLKAMRTHPEVVKLSTNTTIGRRGRLLGRLWRDLTPAQRNVYVKAARSITFGPRPAQAARLQRLVQGRPRHCVRYREFLSRNYPYVTRIHFSQRVAALAHLWKRRQRAL